MTKLNKINKNSQSYIVAEIGFNHLGKMNLAERMIKDAKTAGADAVKLQTFVPDELVFKNSKAYNALNKKELTQDQYKKLIKISKYYEIEFFSTPFDQPSLELLERLKVPHYKVSSPDLNNFFLLDLLSRTKKKVILSTGMSSKTEIIRSHSFLKKKGIETFILHCISNYPAKNLDIALGFLDFLKSLAGWKIGFSDHTLEKDASICAICKGAKIIEKHFTSNNNIKGADNKLALNLTKMKKFIQDIRQTEHMLQNFKDNQSRIDTKNKNIFRRYFYARRKIDPKIKITADDLLILRPNKFIKSVGLISADKFFDIVGKKLKKGLKKNEPVKLKQLY